MDVTALVGGNHHTGVLRQPLHPLLHTAVVLRAAVVAPTSCNVLLSLIIQVIISSMNSSKMYANGLYIEASYTLYMDR